MPYRGLWGLIPKTKRWESKRYTRWVSTLPCINCGAEDGTVVAHHLKGRHAPLSGGAGYKASDWLTMPLCYKCHEKAHHGFSDVLDWQAVFILQTLDAAFRRGIIVHTMGKIGEDLDD